MDFLSLAKTGLSIANKCSSSGSSPEGGAVGASDGEFDIGKMLKGMGGGGQKTEQPDFQQQGPGGNNPIMQVSQLPEDTIGQKQVKLSAYEALSVQMQQNGASVAGSAQSNLEGGGQTGASVGSTAGTVIGTCVGGPVGGFIGGKIGGVLGGKKDSKKNENADSQAIVEQSSLVKQEIQRLKIDLTNKGANTSQTPQSFDSQNLYN